MNEEKHNQQSKYHQKNDELKWLSHSHLIDALLCTPWKDVFKGPSYEAQASMEKREDRKLNMVILILYF